jgi:hypothetical protein
MRISNCNALANFSAAGLAVAVTLRCLRHSPKEVREEEHKKMLEYDMGANGLNHQRKHSEDKH